MRRKSVEEDAVKKDEAGRSVIPIRLCRVRIRSSRRVNQVNAQRTASVQTISPDAESVEYKNLSFIV